MKKSNVFIFISLICFCLAGILFLINDQDKKARKEDEVMTTIFKKMAGYEEKKDNPAYVCEIYQFNVDPYWNNDGNYLKISTTTYESSSPCDPLELEQSKIEAQKQQKIFFAIQKAKNIAEEKAEKERCTKTPLKDLDYTDAVWCAKYLK